MSMVGESVIALHMGEAFYRLSPVLQKTHVGISSLNGVVNVQHGNIFARTICRIFGFPKAGSNLNLSVECHHSRSGMIWHRNFSGQHMRSNFRRRGEFLVEYLGPLALRFLVVEKAGALEYVFKSTSLWGIPLPNFLSPKINAWEKEENGRYVFDVSVNMFSVGLVIRYGGALEVSQLGTE